MSYVHFQEDDGAPVAVPRAALLAAAALALGTIALAAVARQSKGAGDGTPPPVPVAARALVFTDQADGSVHVYDVARREALAPLPAGGGFVRGALRGLARQRRIASVGPEVPFHLARWPDGRITLDDSATGTRLDLRAYGSTNAMAFELLLPPPATAAARRP